MADKSGKGRGYAVTGAWRKAFGILCAVILVLTACAGCTEYAPAEDVEALKAALSEQITALENDNAALRAQIESLQNDNAALHEQTQQLQHDNAEAEQQAQSLARDNESARQEIESLKTENADAQKQIQSLKEENESAQKQIDALREQIRDIKNSISGEDSPEKIRIYIDQGHNPTGFHNSGSIGNGLYEQDLTFTIGTLLGKLLQEDGRFAVCLSRPTANTVLGTDNDSALLARAQGAEDFKADFFISLHTNYFDDASATGIEVYTMKKGSTAYVFGSSILQKLVEATGLKNRGMKQNSYVVLKKTSMPAVLVEMGFISNSGDAALMSQRPELFATGIYNGILDYFGLT